MDYPYAKFSKLVSAVFVLSCGQTDRITHVHTRLTAIFNIMT